MLPSFPDSAHGSGEFNTLLLPDVQKQFVQHVKEVYQRDDTLGNGYISSDLNFQFDGRTVRLEYTLWCAVPGTDYCILQLIQPCHIRLLGLAVDLLDFTAKLLQLLLDTAHTVGGKALRLRLLRSDVRQGRFRRSAGAS